MKRLLVICVACAVLASACASAEAVKPLPGRAGSQEGSGDESLRRGDVADAKRRYEAALRGYRRVDDQPGIAAAFVKMGNANMLDGDYTLAADYFEQARQIAVRENLKDIIVEAASSGAMAEIARGDIPRAEEALAAAQAAGLAGWRRDNAFGRLAAAKGDAEEAKKLFAAALEAARAAKDTAAEAACRINLAKLLLQAGDAEGALPHLNRTLSLNKADEAVLAIGETLHLLGKAFEAKKEYSSARNFYIRAYGVNCAAGMARRAAEDQTAISRVEGMMKETAPAR